MASIARCRDALKSEPFAQSGFVRAYLSKEDLDEAAAAANYHGRDRTWTLIRILWPFLLQALHPGWSCREAVAHVLAQYEAAGTPLKASPDPSAYSQGRKRLPLSLFRFALRQTGETLEARVGEAYRWCGRRVWIVDGSSCSMPDTAELQEAFGQPTGQKKGCGFPVAKFVVMFCWASGVVHDVAIGPYRSNELALWRELWGQLKGGDVVLGDRFYGAYADLAQLRARGCDGVFRLRGSRARTISFRQGQRLGKNDRLFHWSRPPQCPRTLTPEEFAQLPATLTVRVLRFDTRIKGFRSRRILVVTTLLDPKAFPLEKIAALYRDRWTAELRIREVKTTLKMEILRGKSEDVVRKEIYMHLLAYNLMRALMWQAAQPHGKLLHRLSFAGTLQRFHAVAPYLWLFTGTPQAAPLYQLLLSWIARDYLPERPDRIEPRAVKRRPKPYDLLTRPRKEMQEALLR
jgi:hypothetical protein